MITRETLAYNNRGNAKSDLQDYQGAIADYTKAIEINPQLAPAYYNRGLAKYDLKDYQGAIADYSKAIEINPQYADAYYNRGLAKELVRDLKVLVLIGKKHPHWGFKMLLGG